MVISLDALFTTVAQISFGLIGLLIIAIAGDSESRQFWLHRESRAVFSFLTFIPILLPGLFALGCLIFSSADTDKITMFIPSWPFSAFITGGIYWWLFNLASQNKEMKDYAEFLRLDKHLSIMDVIKFSAGLFISFAIAGFSAYLSRNLVLQAFSEIIMGVVLVFAVSIGSLTAIQMFRQEFVLKNLSNSNQVTLKEEQNSERQTPQKPPLVSFKPQKTAIVLVGAVIAASLFLLKKFFRNKTK